MRAALIGAIAAAVALTGCREAKDEARPEGARAEIADIRSRIDQRIPAADRQVEEYVEHIESSTVARDRKAERIEERAPRDEGDALAEIRELRGRAEAADPPVDEWARRFVNGRLERLDGETAVIEDEIGAEHRLTLSPFTEKSDTLAEGAEVRASYELRDGEKVATELGPAD